MFEAAEIKLMIDSATERTRAWILLGINCAFIQRDISDLVQSAVDLEAGIIDFPKRKTAIERRVPLWKQTLEALRYVDTTSNSDDRFFHTTTGQVLVVDLSNDSRSDAVHGAFERLQNKFGI